MASLLNKIMKPDEINFDENYSMDQVAISEQLTPVCITILDELEAVEQPLTDEYKNVIVDFINNSVKWYSDAINIIKEDVKNIDGIKLMTIYVLFEQNDLNHVFGLLFNLNFDREHGRGMVIDGNDFSIISYGGAEKAFGG